MTMTHLPFSLRSLITACLLWSLLSSCSEKGPLKNTPTTASATSGGNVNEIRFVNKADEQKLEVWIGEKLFTNYMYPDEVAKPILYPLITAGGTTLTRGFPLDPQPGERADHPHHVGLWLNYGDVNGLDFWNNPGKPPAEKLSRYGFIVHRSVENINNCPEKGCFDVVADWKTSDGKTLLVEKTGFKFTQQGTTRSITRTTTLTAAAEEVSFRDNKEGMIAARVIREMELPSEKPVLLIGADGRPGKEKILDNEGVSGNYLSSEGLEGNEVWGSRAKWVKMYGTVEGKNVAMVIFDHPENVGYPTYWHARGYGLFSANPLGQKIFSKGKEELDFRLEPGESTTFKYRVFIHEGPELTMEQLNREFELFAAL